jgi:hypothetical protein
MFESKSFFIYPEVIFRSKVPSVYKQLIISGFIMYLQRKKHYFWLRISGQSRDPHMSRSSDRNSRIQFFHIRFVRGKTVITRENQGVGTNTFRVSLV